MDDATEEIKEEEIKEGTLRVWWIPQIPMGNPFHVPVKNVDEAIIILETLARYDAYQFDNNIKPDYSNAGGLEVFTEERGWEEYYDDDDDCIDEIIKKRKENE